ncbi:MAG TPA: hypothetical protein VLH75_05040 [Longimicrobiales bacterium]|nr:hypothetical protein [Longimicrobiales bacterium]
MDPQKTPVYREWSSWSGWILVMFWGVMFIAMANVSMTGPGSDQDRFWGAMVVGGVAVGVQLLVAGLSVRLYRDHLTVGLGSAGLISKRVRYDQIVRTESVTYSPLREFGGWGIRWGKDGRKVWSARGNHAVVLHLRDGTRLYVGSDSPHRLEERIRAVAGTRIGGRG